MWVGKVRAFVWWPPSRQTMLTQTVSKCKCKASILIYTRPCPHHNRGPSHQPLPLRAEESPPDTLLPAVLGAEAGVWSRCASEALLRQVLEPADASSGALDAGVLKPGMLRSLTVEVATTGMLVAGPYAAGGGVTSAMRASRARRSASWVTELAPPFWASRSDLNSRSMRQRWLIISALPSCTLFRRRMQQMMTGVMGRGGIMAYTQSEYVQGTEDKTPPLRFQ